MTVVPARSRHALPARVAPACARPRGSRARAAGRGRTHVGRRGRRRRGAAPGSRRRAGGGRARSSSSMSRAPFGGPASTGWPRANASPMRSPVRAARPRRPTPLPSTSPPRSRTGCRCSYRGESREVAATPRAVVSASARRPQPNSTRSPASGRSRLKRSSTTAPSTAAFARSRISTRSPGSAPPASSSCETWCHPDRARLADAPRAHDRPRPRGRERGARAVARRRGARRRGGARCGEPPRSATGVCVRALARRLVVGEPAARSVREQCPHAGDRAVRARHGGRDRAGTPIDVCVAASSGGSSLRRALASGTGAARVAARPIAASRGHPRATSDRCRATRLRGGLRRARLARTPRRPRRPPRARLADRRPPRRHRRCLGSASDACSGARSRLDSKVSDTPCWPGSCSARTRG